LLFQHPEATVTAVASTSVVGERLDAALPPFRGLTDLLFQPLNAEKLAEDCDVVFVGVPGTQSMPIVADLQAAGVKVIDIGPDFRLKDTDQFKKFYGKDHEASGLLSKSVYGLVPWYRDALKSASIVAVPGCYPISILLPLRPLLEAPLSDIPVIADAISGISGAGKSPSDALHFPEMNENLCAYKVGVHQHTPEIEQELLGKITMQFTPHIAPITRGILSTITLRPESPFNPKDFYDCYANEPFVRVLGEGELPQVKHVVGSNFCDFGWVTDERTGNIVLVSAIDNIMGGTAGMAVQCMNIMFDAEETTGLLAAGFGP
jgi:N-acetyl-gamma-glutamyl-phosphate reductase